MMLNIRQFSCDSWKKISRLSLIWQSKEDNTARKKIGGSKESDRNNNQMKRRQFSTQGSETDSEIWQANKFNITSRQTFHTVSKRTQCSMKYNRVNRIKTYNSSHAKGQFHAHRLETQCERRPANKFIIISRQIFDTAYKLETTKCFVPSSLALKCYRSD